MVELSNSLCIRPEGEEETLSSWQGNTYILYISAQNDSIVVQVFFGKGFIDIFMQLVEMAGLGRRESLDRKRMQAQATYDVRKERRCSASQVN